jgi:CRP/FNR family cyclic AMP-dependent transcriptional regulator
MEVLMTALLTQGCLKPHLFLDHCTDDFLNHLEGFATEVNFAAGETILREGDYADRFYLICEGRVALESGSNGQPGIALQVLGPGDVLGWSWLFAPFEWHFSARAIEQCRAVALNAPALLIRAEEDPAFGAELFKRIGKQVIQRLQVTRKRLVQELKSRKECEYAI